MRRCCGAHAKPHDNRETQGNDTILIALLGLFFGTVLVIAAALQVWLDESPATPGTGTDRFNSVLLMATSVLALLIASEHARPLWKLLFWLGVTAALAALAIDEVFEFHEETQQIVEDDDYIKMVAWACAGAGAFLIYRLERPVRIATRALIAAFIFQTLWLLSDLGDGDYFSVPLSDSTLSWSEEFLEILSTEACLFALIFIYRSLLTADRRIRD